MECNYKLIPVEMGKKQQKKQGDFNSIQSTPTDGQISLHLRKISLFCITRNKRLVPKVNISLLFKPLRNLEHATPT